MKPKKPCAWATEQAIGREVIQRVVWPTKAMAKKHIDGMKQCTAASTFKIVPIHAIVGFFNERHYP